MRRARLRGSPLSMRRPCRSAGASLLRKWRAEAVLITRGAEGMSLFRPAVAVQAFSHRTARRFRRHRRGRYGRGGLRAWRWLAAPVMKRRRCWQILPPDWSAMKSARWRCRSKNSIKTIKDKNMKSMTGYGEASQNIRGDEGDRANSQLESPSSGFAVESAARISVLRRGDSQSRFAKRSRAAESMYLSIDTQPREQARKLEMDEALVGQYIAGVRQLKKKYQIGRRNRRLAASPIFRISFMCARSRSMAPASARRYSKL